ncbi:alpha-mannosidase [Streptomyces sp. B6B3]|uniref:glycoside hydrolase family 38 N-terminal domain-containing protein n=1 Tax=Streptomyces sp. B6B3 TaxID=3153570 RepID=UPI00325F55BB
MPEPSASSAPAAPARENARALVIVPHTHWDREWYLPFQRFRLQLVGLLDELLDRMERDPRQRFTLDGQMAAVDDYLEVRPEARERVAALVKSGRLAIGPWDILMDEFLCSGEQMIRNLERGIRRAEELGAAMPVGYLPDMFGHIAQMPQLLRGAGLAHACVYRGVPSSVTTDTFAWEAPDGTAIRTRFLAAGGYGNAAGLLEDPERAEARLLELVERMEPWAEGPDAPPGLDGLGGAPMLGMYGSDHTAPAADAPDLLAAVGERTGVPVRLATLAEFFAALPETVAGLPVTRGELRSHSRSNILPGVISVRPALKQAMARAERTVERYAEPLAALFGDRTERRFLDLAWRHLISVSCHDSVTGCGCDETAVQVGARMAEAEQLGQAVCDMTLARLARDVPRDAHLVVNPSPRPRAGVVLLATEAPERGADVLADDVLADPELALTRIHGTELYGQHITGWSLSGNTLTFRVAHHTDTPFDVADVRALLRERPEGAPLRVRILAVPRRTVPVWAEAPALGHAAVRVPTEPPLSQYDVRASGRVMDNGLVGVAVAADGTFTLSTPGGAGGPGVTATGLGGIVDGGDLGDSYNYAPPAADLLVTEPATVRVTPVLTDPLASAIEITRGYAWPAAGDFAADGREERAEAITVTTRLELRAAEPFVRLTVRFDNRCDDHRVRLHLPLPRRATASYAEGQFAVVERGLTAEGGGGEHPLPTFPASGFVAAGGLAALLTEYTEYELVNHGRELALTVLRAVGQLSRNRHVHRDEPAGPQVPTPGAQSRGVREVSLALMPYADSWEEVVPAAEDYRHPLLTTPGAGPAGGALPPAAPGLTVTGTGVVLSSLRERDGRVELRVVAETDRPTTATVAGPVAHARHADLLGRPGDDLPVTDGTVTLPLRPWQIATLHLDLTTPDA